MSASCCNSVTYNGLSIIVPQAPDITITVPSAAVQITLQPQGPPGPQGASGAGATAPVQTVNFTLAPEFVWWPIDASNGNIVITVPEGALFADYQWYVSRVDLGKPINNHTVDFLMTGEDLLYIGGKQLALGELLVLQGDNAGFKNLSTVTTIIGGSVWVLD